MQSASDRSDGHVEDLGNLLVLLPFDVFQHEHGPMVEAQPQEDAVERVTVGDARVVVAGLDDVE